jgi:hypothetical protein
VLLQHNCPPPQSWQYGVEPVQTFPHAPQLVGSAKETHFPLQQWESTPPHSCPQAPQLRGSVWMLTQSGGSPQQLLPSGQQVRLQQTPLEQHVPVQPVSVQTVEQLAWPVGQQTPAPHS